MNTISIRKAKENRLCCSWFELNTAASPISCYHRGKPKWFLRTQIFHQSQHETQLREKHGKELSICLHIPDLAGRPNATESFPRWKVLTVLFLLGGKEEGEHAMSSDTKMTVKKRRRRTRRRKCMKSTQYSLFQMVCTRNTSQGHSVGKSADGTVLP